MASILGIELKNIKTFRGVEYPTCYQGNVYLNGKKLGFWSQDSWGGPDSYEFKTTELDNLAKAYYGKDSYYDLDCLMGEILTLKDYEKLYKKIVKEGYASLVVITDGYFETTIKMPRDTNKELILEKCAPYVEKFKKNTNNVDNVKTLVFTNITDFVQ